MKQLFGHTRDGQAVHLFTLTNKHGHSVELTDFGAAIRKIIVPDKNGKLTDVTVCRESFEDALINDGYFGATCGRVANRVSGAAFDLDGKHHKITETHPGMQLHGGKQGFSHKLWTAEELPSPGNKVAFTLTSPDGDEGYPANLNVRAEYTWDDGDRLTVAYSATADAPTYVNLTNHVYFNLNGGGTALDHPIKLNCDKYLPVKDVGGNAFVTGELADVTGTEMDFREYKTIRSGAFSDWDQIRLPGGYDNHFVVRDAENPCAEAIGEISGITLKCYTDYPGIHFYSGCNMQPFTQKYGLKTEKFGAFCLETSFFPDFINHPEFGQHKHILRPGSEYRNSTDYVFSTK